VSATFLRLTGMTRRHGSRSVVDDVSLDVAFGEVVVILGPSGSGKTTLLRLIAGLDVPDHGEIWLDGRRVTERDRRLVPPHQRRIGFVFQDLALWPHLTVRENLGFVVGSAGVAKAGRDERIRHTLALVRIDALANRYPHEISGGEQQRAALARALVGEPRLLLLDEPFSSLDAELRATLRGELDGLQRALRLTTVYVTHDREDARALADRIVEMRHGRIVAVHETERRERDS